MFQWVVLQCVIVLYPAHPYFLLLSIYNCLMTFLYDVDFDDNGTEDYVIYELRQKRDIYIKTSRFFHIFRINIVCNSIWTRVNQKLYNYYLDQIN